jgi:hypothetical protein
VSRGRTGGRLVGAALALAVAGATAGCGPSPEALAEDLCRDLRSFRATFELLEAPPPWASVGEVRGALEKVAPFLERLADAPQTPAPLEDELAEVETAFRDVVEGIGDDEPASVLVPGDAPARLRRALAASAASLGCPGVPGG